MSYLDLFEDAPTDKTDIDPVVFVATDMTVITISDSRSSRDIVIENAKHYRRLSPEYWTWFNYKYHLMEQALRNSKISEETFKVILDRISKIYNLALASFGKDALDEAVRCADAKKQPRNQPPSIVFERGNERRRVQ